MLALAGKGFLKFYIAQATAGGVVGFIVPWLQFFGVL